MIGGLTGYTDFIRGIYEEGGREYFDIMNIHTYGVPINWGMLRRGYLTRRTMADYGDKNRPIWNTEFGIDAGNLWAASRVNTTEGFDQGQKDQIETGIRESRRFGIYLKYFPYQFYAPNESGFDVKSAGVKFPEGYTIDDYGFGMLRRDGKTPRPAYDFLLESQFNKKIQAEPKKTPPGHHVGAPENLSTQT